MTTQIAENIKSLRMSAKLSQNELAKIIGVSKIMVGEYESGKRKPKLERLIQLADFFVYHLII